MDNEINSNHNISTKGSDKKSKGADHETISSVDKRHELRNYRGNKSNGMKNHIRQHSMNPHDSAMLS